MNVHFTMKNVFCNLFLQLPVQKNIKLIGTNLIVKIKFFIDYISTLEGPIVATQSENGPRGEERRSNR